MKGIIYVRVSSDEQVLGTSLAFQEEICRKYCDENGIAIMEVFREEGASAKTTNRPELMRALEFCRKQKPAVQAFVVAKVDRFARNTEDHFTVRGALKRIGVNLHSVTEPIGNSPTERLLETVLAGSAEFDNAIRTQRSTDGMKAQLKRGIWPWKVPIGYLSAGTKRQGLKKLVADRIDPDRFSILQQGLQAYAAGEFQSLTHLAEFLTRQGLRTQNGKGITKQMTDRILGRYLVFYAGLLHDPFTGDEVIGNHIPMITTAQRRQIRSIRSGRVRHVRPRDALFSEFPLRRSVLCYSCKQPLTASSPRGRSKRYAYYHCASKPCERYGRSYPQAEVEKAFGEWLRTIRLKFGGLPVLVQAILERSKEQRTHELSRRSSLLRAVATLQLQRARIFEMREDGSYTRDQFIERQSQIDEKIEQEQIQLAALQVHSLQVAPLIRDALEFLRDMLGDWQSLSFDHKRRFQRILFPQGIPYDRETGFGTAKLPYICEAVSGSSGELSRGVPPMGPGWNQLMEDMTDLRAIHDELKRGYVPDISDVPMCPNLNTIIRKAA